MELRPGLDPKTGDMDMDITHATEIPREHEEEPKPEFPICETCLNLQVSAGDPVPYGSTTAQFPDEWDCKAAWTEPDADEQIEARFLGTEQACPHYEPMPKCPKHPNEHQHPRWGCPKCEDEMYQIGKEE